jgi:hypothetical protein
VLLCAASLLPSAFCGVVGARVECELSSPFLWLACALGRLADLGGARGDRRGPGGSPEGSAGAWPITTADGLALSGWGAFARVSERRSPQAARAGERQGGASARTAAA